MKTTILTSIALVSALLAGTSNAIAVETVDKAVAKQATVKKEATTSKTSSTISAEYRQHADKTRAAAEAKQEEAFKAHIESLKNYSGLQSMPAEVQKRRAAMIQQLQEQHNFSVKMRKMHRDAFEKRRNEQMIKMQKI